MQKLHSGRQGVRPSNLCPSDRCGALVRCAKHPSPPAAASPLRPPFRHSFPRPPTIILPCIPASLHSSISIIIIFARRCCWRCCPSTMRGCASSWDPPGWFPLQLPSSCSYVITAPSSHQSSPVFTNLHQSSPALTPSPIITTMVIMTLCDTHAALTAVLPTHQLERHILQLPKIYYTACLRSLREPEDNIASR